MRVQVHVKVQIEVQVQDFGGRRTVPLAPFAPLTPFCATQDPQPPLSRAPRTSPRFLEDRLHLALADCAGERGVVLLVLVGAGHREGRNGAIERVALAQVPAERDRASGPGVGERKRPATPAGVEVQLTGAEVLT